MRLLALDIGNTNVTAGLFDGAILQTSFRLRTDPHRTADEYAALMGTLIGLREGPAGLGSVNAVAIASVVPAVTTTLQKVCTAHIGLEPYVVTAADNATGLAICYEPPASLGADRLVNAFAANELYCRNDARPAGVIVVDYGTATKFEVVDENHTYRGGAILPGVGISLDALYERAALLRQIPLSPPPGSAIGQNTADALRAGILLGYAAQTDGLVARIRAELGNPTVPVIATGGLADLVAPHTATVDKVDVNLTITGLRLLFERRASGPPASRNKEF